MYSISTFIQSPDSDFVKPSIHFITESSNIIYENINFPNIIEIKYHNSDF